MSKTVSKGDMEEYFNEYVDKLTTALNFRETDW